MGEEKYLYCIIKCPDKREFGIEGIGNSDKRVYTINHEDLAAVITDSPGVREYEVNHQNALTHELVIEKVMEEFTVLPVGFGCVAESSNQIINRVLKANFNELYQLIEKMEGKVELGLKAIWKDKQILQQQLKKENPNFMNRLTGLLSNQQAGKKTIDPGRLIVKNAKAGEMLVAVIDKIRENQTRKIVSYFDHLVLEKRFKKVAGPLVIFNLALLIDKQSQSQFDAAIDKMDEEQGKDIKFIFVGSAPPFSFVEFRMELD